MDQNPDLGVNASPAIDQQGQTVSDETVQIQPTGSEAVTNPGNVEEQSVPYSRFQEVNDRAKAAEEEARKAREALESHQQNQSPQNNDDIDPEVEKLLDSYAKRRGLVSQSELETDRMRLQVQQDVKSFESSPPVNGVPYIHKDILDYASKNNIPVTSKAALEATYKQMNWDKIVEAERQRAIEGFKTGNGSSAERPGSTGARPPEEPTVTGKSAKERTRSRIGAARQRLNI